MARSAVTGGSTRVPGARKKVSPVAGGSIPVHPLPKTPRARWRAARAVPSALMSLTVALLAHEFHRSDHGACIRAGLAARDEDHLQRIALHRAAAFEAAEQVGHVEALEVLAQRHVHRAAR